MEKLDEGRLQSVLNEKYPWKSLIVVGSENETQVIREAGEISRRIAKRPRNKKIRESDKTISNISNK
jgi:hypothetical protein